MATHTVYGCYDKTTGIVEFDDTYSGCTSATITGCLVLSGEHKGKIEITHDYDGCETDEYFACYDPDTGKFEYDADDDCCEIDWVESECCGVDCTAAPTFITAVFSGITCYLWGCQLNGTFVLPITYNSGGRCTWGTGWLTGNPRQGLSCSITVRIEHPMTVYTFFKPRAQATYRSNGEVYCACYKYVEIETPGNCDIAHCGGAPFTTSLSGNYPYCIDAAVTAG